MDAGNLGRVWCFGVCLETNTHVFWWLQEALHGADAQQQVGFHGTMPQDVKHRATLPPEQNLLVPAADAIMKNNTTLRAAKVFGTGKKARQYGSSNMQVISASVFDCSGLCYKQRLSQQASSSHPPRLPPTNFADEAQVQQVGTAQHATMATSYTYHGCAFVRVRVRVRVRGLALRYSSSYLVLFHANETRLDLLKCSLHSMFPAPGLQMLSMFNPRHFPFLQPGEGLFDKLKAVAQQGHYKCFPANTAAAGTPPSTPPRPQTSTANLLGPSARSPSGSPAVTPPGSPLFASFGGDSFNPAS